MIQPQITLQSYLHSETFNLGRHLEVTCNARYRFLDHWRTTFKRCSQSIASVRLLSPFRMSAFRTIAFALHLEHVSFVIPTQPEAFVLSMLTSICLTCLSGVRACQGIALCEGDQWDGFRTLLCCLTACCRMALKILK